MRFTVINGKRIMKVAILLSLSVAFFVALFSSKAYMVFYGRNTRELPIYSVRTEEKKIAISFDCAWGVDYTDKLLSVMKDEDVKCTFFAVEFWVKKYPDYVKKIDAFGHEIGTHSATHPHMNKLNRESVIKELTSSCQAITNITGKEVTLFRPPYGEYNDQLITCAKELNLHSIEWSVDSLDWKNLSKSEIENRVIKNVKNGSIVLFHNQGLHTHEALLTIIKTLKQQGFSFVPIGELIYKDNYKILPDGTQVKCS